MREAVSEVINALMFIGSIFVVIAFCQFPIN